MRLSSEETVRANRTCRTFRPDRLTNGVETFRYPADVTKFRLAGDGRRRLVYELCGKREKNGVSSERYPLHRGAWIRTIEARRGSNTVTPDGRKQSRQMLGDSRRYTDDECDYSDGASSPETT
jgi:hypothetical protein